MGRISDDNYGGLVDSDGSSASIGGVIKNRRRGRSTTPRQPPSRREPEGRLHTRNDEQQQSIEQDDCCQGIDISSANCPSIPDGTKNVPSLAKCPSCSCPSCQNCPIPFYSSKVASCTLKATNDDHHSNDDDDEENSIRDDEKMYSIQRDDRSNGVHPSERKSYGISVGSSLTNPCIPFQLGDAIAPSYSDLQCVHSDNETQPSDEGSDTNPVGSDGYEERDTSSRGSSLTECATNPRRDIKQFGDGGTKPTAVEGSRLCGDVYDECDRDHTLIKLWERKYNQPSSYHYSSGTCNTDTSNIIKKVPPPTCDLIILVGHQEFHHSSAILAYASDYLNSRMELYPGTEGNRDLYLIDFSHHSPDEWRIVVEFLQPRSLGVRELTSENIPIVLPWFNQFGLKVLLDDIDRFFLETIVTQTEGELTVSNLVLLTRISHECNLQTTKSHARQWLRRKLLDPRRKNTNANTTNNVKPPGTLLDWDLTDLQTLTACIAKFEQLRNYVWESAIILYLPHDLKVEDSYGLASNPLLPYLLREGMMQLCISQDQQQRQQQQQQFQSSSNMYQQHRLKYYDVEDEKEEKSDDPTIQQHQQRCNRDFVKQISSSSSSVASAESSHIVLKLNASSASSSALFGDAKRLTQNKLNVFLEEIAYYLDKYNHENDLMDQKRIYNKVVAEREAYERKENDFLILDNQTTKKQKSRKEDTKTTQHERKNIQTSRVDSKKVMKDKKDEIQRMKQKSQKQQRQQYENQRQLQKKQQQRQKTASEPQSKKSSSPDVVIRVSPGRRTFQC